MIQPPKEKPIVSGSPAFDVTLLSLVFLAALSAMVALTRALGWGEVEIAQHFHSESTRTVFVWLRRWLDVGWVIAAWLAAYRCCVVEDGARKARRICLIGLAVALATLLLERVWPVGPVIRYTDELGPKPPGGIPAGAIVLWTALLLAVRSAVWRMGRSWPVIAQMGIGVGMLIPAAIAIDCWLAKPSGWWLWSSRHDLRVVISFSWLTPICWSLAAGFFLLATRRTFSGKETHAGWIIFVTIVVVAVLSRLARWLLT